MKNYQKNLLKELVDISSYTIFLTNELNTDHEVYFPIFLQLDWKDLINISNYDLCWINKLMFEKIEFLVLSEILDWNCSNSRFCVIYVISLKV